MPGYVGELYLGENSVGEYEGIQQETGVYVFSWNRGQTGAASGSFNIVPPSGSGGRLLLALFTFSLDIQNPVVDGDMSGLTGWTKVATSSTGSPNIFVQIWETEDQGSTDFIFTRNKVLQVEWQIARIVNHDPAKETLAYIVSSQ